MKVINKMLKPFGLAICKREQYEKYVITHYCIVLMKKFLADNPIHKDGVFGQLIEML